MYPRRRAAALLAATPAAHAATVGPGAPMRVPDATSQPPGVCTQGVPGTTRTVMVTAAHCLIGDTVHAPLAAGDSVIGHLDATSGALLIDATLPPLQLLQAMAADLVHPDWATVTLIDGVDWTRVSQSTGGPAVELTGVRDHRRLAPHEVSPDNFGQPICKDGTVSGRSCGIQLARTRDTVWSYGTFYESGDSGGPNFDPRTGEAIGLTSLSLGPLDRSQLLDSALEDAYVLPDGEVNQHFRLPEPAVGHRGDFRTVAEDEARLGTRPQQHTDILIDLF